MMASTVADNVSTRPAPLSVNPSRKCRCLRARAAMVASAYTYDQGWPSAAIQVQPQPVYPYQIALGRTPIQNSQTQTHDFGQSAMDFGQGVGEGVVANEITNGLRGSRSSPTETPDTGEAAAGSRAAEELSQETDTKMVTAGEAVEAERAVEAGRAGMLVEGVTAAGEIIEGAALLEFAMAGLVAYGIIKYLNSSNS